MAEVESKTVLRHLYRLQALDREVRKAVDRQQRDGRLSEQQDVARLVDHVESILAHQSERLEQRIDAVGGTRWIQDIQSRLGRTLKVVEGLWQDLHEVPLSTALRDHYAALNLIAAHYTMLHAAAQAVGDTTTADLAYQHLKEITPLVVETSQVLPVVVVAEVATEHEDVDLTAATAAVQATHSAWKPEVTERPLTQAAG